MSLLNFLGEFLECIEKWNACHSGQTLGPDSFESYRIASERLTTFESTGDGNAEQLERLKAALRQQRPHNRPAENIDEVRRKRSQEEMRAQVKMAEAQAQKMQSLGDIPFSMESPARPPSPTGVGGCTLKLLFQNGNTILQNFDVNDTFEAVYQYVCSVVPAARNKKIVFETSLPKQIINENMFRESLASYQLVPRGQLVVRYVS
jgi:hypothetical protein